MGLVTTDAPPAPVRDGRRRPASGTVFVLVCAALAVAYVAFLVVGSPVLLERTLANAPPPAPQQVAAGSVDGAAWTAEAYDAAEGLRVVGADGVEPIVDPEPCMRLVLDGTAHALCVERRGTSIRDVAATSAAGGSLLVYGVVAPEVTAVEVRDAAGGSVHAEPTYVDFGFPLGFFVATLDGSSPVTAVRATDRDSAVRATATCAQSAAPLADCAVTEGDY